MTPKVFISYRRDDSAPYAGRVHDRLEHEFGRDLLFMDVDSVPLGVNFIKVLREEVAKCDVLLAVIGPHWINAQDETGNRRLDSPNDFVRIEIAAALLRDIPVIPILLDGAKIPKSDQLPEDLKELALRNALDVRHASFHSDMSKLISGLRNPSTHFGVTPVAMVSERKNPEGVPVFQGGAAERTNQVVEAKDVAEEAPQSEADAPVHKLEDFERRGQEVRTSSLNASMENLPDEALTRRGPDKKERHALRGSLDLLARPKSRIRLLAAIVLTLLLLGSFGGWLLISPNTRSLIEPPSVPPSTAANTQIPSVFTALSAAAEQALQPKNTFKECSICPEMVVVPSGNFAMGSPTSEESRHDDEGPQHPVSIKEFAVGSSAVTVEQFSAFVDQTGYRAGATCQTFEAGKLDQRAGRSWRNPGFVQIGSHPAVCLSWSDAKAYVGWLSKETNKDYRLLTEAEYEYAIRGKITVGPATRYFFGNDDASMCRYGNGADQTAQKTIPGASGWTIFPCADGYAYTAPVGSFLPNEFGLYDPHGNAASWTEDCYHDSYSGAPTDGKAWLSGDCNRRVIRGGSWDDNRAFLRSASRGRFLSVGRSSEVGFRVGRTLMAVP
jgi:formylglycine-generating enzyme required for sulfatase activity